MARERIQISYECPSCGAILSEELDVLIESGEVPTNEFTCSTCCCRYTVEAVMDLNIKVIQ